MEMTVFRRAAIILAVLAGMIGFGQPALGQTGTGRSGHSTSGELGNVKALGDLIAFGRCFATSERKLALALIATQPGSREEDRVINKVTGGDQVCLFGGTHMTASTVFLRGTIAEGLLKEGGVPADLQLPAPSGEATSLSEAARCYTAGHRAEVKALLDMKAGSREEVAAVGATWPGFKACLPKRANVRLNALWIRFLLAEALLRLPPPGAAQ